MLLCKKRQDTIITKYWLFTIYSLPIFVTLLCNKVRFMLLKILFLINLHVISKITCWLYASNLWRAGHCGGFFKNNLLWFLIFITTKVTCSVRHLYNRDKVEKAQPQHLGGYTPARVINSKIKQGQNIKECEGWSYELKRLLKERAIEKVIFE